MIDQCTCSHLAGDHIIERINPYTKQKELHCVYCACHGFIFPVQPGDGFVGWEIGCHWDGCNYRTNGFPTAEEATENIRYHIKSIHLNHD